MKEVLIVSGGPGGPTPEGGTGGRGLPLEDGTFLGVPDPPSPEASPVGNSGVGRVEDIGKDLRRTRISRDTMFTMICQVVAQRSTCWRSQVGAVIVKEGRVVSMGYNGPVSGMPACIRRPPYWSSMADYLPREDQMGWELEENRKKMEKLICMGPGCTRSLHAETNAIAFAARAGVSVEGCTMYCTMSPCINCAKVIVNSGIKKLVYMEEYRDTSGLDLLKSAGIVVVHLDAIDGEITK